MSSNDPTKRIPKSLDTDTQLFGKYSLTDLVVAALPGVLVVLVTQIVLPSSLRIYGISVTALTIPLALFAIGIGALFVYLTPRYTTSLDWLGLFIHFHRTENDIAHDEAKQYTQVERVWPERNSIERTDGVIIGAVQVSPPTMALATNAEWAEKTNAFQDFVNTTIEFPIQIYSTTQSFPADDYIGQYEDRLDDSDVRSNEKLTALIEHYVTWYESELAQRQMTIRDHYVIVPVRPDEIRYERESLLQKLVAIPCLGLLVKAWTAPSIQEERQAMFETLDDRLRRVERGLREIEGCDTRRVEAEELTRIVGEFWAGQDLDYGNLTKRIRTTPMINTITQS